MMAEEVNTVQNQGHKGIGRWVRVTRTPFLQASIIPVAVAGAIAFKDGALEPLPFLLAVFAIIFIHLGVNTANDYYDHLQKTDELNPRPTPFSGGSRVIQEKLEKPTTVLAVSIACFIIGVTLGSYVVYLRWETPLLVIGLAGVILGFFYTAPPLKLVYRGLGELTVFILLGPLAVLGGYYAAAGKFSSEALYASIPVGIWVMLILLVNEFPDAESDRQAKKNHLVVLLGKESAAKLYAFFAYASFTFTALAVAFSLLPVAALSVLAAFTGAFTAIKYLLKNPLAEDYLPAQVATIKTDLNAGLLLTAAFILTGLM